MIIIIIGWITVVAIVIVLGLWIYSIIWDFYDGWIANQRYQGVRDLVQRLKGGSYWLNTSKREPFRKLYDFIVSEIERTGNVNYELLRSKVDEIIKETEND